jgi:hypothetical protein
MDLVDQYYDHYYTETEVWDSPRGCPIELSELKQLADERCELL